MQLQRRVHKAFHQRALPGRCEEKQLRAKEEVQQVSKAYEEAAKRKVEKDKKAQAASGGVTRRIGLRRGVSDYSMKLMAVGFWDEEEDPKRDPKGLMAVDRFTLRLMCKEVQQTPVAETDPVDRTTFNQIFSQLTETGELAVERLAEGLEMLEGVGCDKEWIHEILRDQFNGRSFLDRSDFYDFVNMHLALRSGRTFNQYRNQRFTFMRKIFSEVQLLGRRGITPVLSCVERIFREVTGESGLRDLTFEELASQRYDEKALCIAAYTEHGEADSRYFVVVGAYTDAANIGSSMSEEFVKIYDVVQARAGFSEYDLVRLKKVWSRYDRDGNQLLSADELRVALKWQGFAVDAGVVDSLAQEVADGKGLNQREFLIFMRKYRDQEVQKIMQMGVATKPEFKGRRDHIKVTRETRVQMKDLPMLLSEIGYEEVASEVMQECASLVHLVDLDAARGLQLAAL
ncbi:ZNFX1 [Symbiodinium sp. KB8]|nr:ZNFX1 [Symbiodinium sp. KB8]